jgi:hypothetical protein
MAHLELRNRSDVEIDATGLLLVMSFLNEQIPDHCLT